MFRMVERVRVIASLVFSSNNIFPDYSHYAPIISRQLD
jgi:hypothetical protein